MYETAKKIAFGFIIAYFCIGVTAHATSRSQEDVYPFFSWFLFANVPPRIQSGFEIEVTSVEGKKLASPERLAASSPLFKKGEVSEKYLGELSERLGYAVTRRDAGAIEATSKELGSRLVKPAGYQISQVTFNPIDKWARGETISRTVIASFSHE